MKLINIILAIRILCIGNSFSWDAVEQELVPLCEASGVEVEIHNLYYDNVSLNHSSRRKRQDAVHNILYGTCVCEGYANLYAAFARSVGIQTRYVSSSPMNHGWVNVLYKNQWKLVDVTWDDPVSSNSDSYCDIAPDAENYSYFMIALDGINGDHYSPVISNARSATGDVIPPKMKNMPDGWY